MLRKQKNTIESSTEWRRSELYHHGVQGQKWGVRNGPPYPLQKARNFHRYSNVNEKSIRKGTYMSYGRADDKAYRSLALSGKGLGFEGSKQQSVYRMTIQQINKKDPLLIRDGRQTTQDLLDMMGDKDASAVYEKYVKKGYFDSSKRKSNWDHWNKLTDDETYELTQLGHTANVFIKKHKNEILKKYSKYDLVVDPEDFIYGYMHPYIVTNPSKFKITNTKKVR